MIAAVAEVNGATLLHYDHHFDTIARVTGQPMEWLARRQPRLTTSRAKD